jgi:hypothetical protein
MRRKIMDKMIEARQLLTALVPSTTSIFVDCTVASYSYKIPDLSEPRCEDIDYRISLVENGECIQVHGRTLEEALDKIIDSLTCETMVGR